MDLLYSDRARNRIVCAFPVPLENGSLVRVRALLCVLLLAAGLAAQTFDVASVKPSPRAVSKDYRGSVVLRADRITAHNVSLKSLIAEAWRMQPFQVTGGPGWLDNDEYDLDARAGAPASPAALRTMLQALLAGRFHLACHAEIKEMRVYALVLDKGGPKLQPTQDDPRPLASPRDFRGSMRQLANLISVQLSIPPLGGDPSRPSIASGAPAPVIDKTGLEGNYAISVDIQPEANADMFTLWQRALRERYGLRLENQRAPIDVLVVDRADRVPTPN